MAVIIKKFNNKEIGFTILELIITIFILTIGILGVYYLVNLPMYYTSTSVSRLTASYLAQEGIEVVRNIRDQNLLIGNNWNFGLIDGDHQAAYNDSVLSSFTGVKLKFDGNYYSYSSINDTLFTREITLTNNPGLGYLNVSVFVSWTGKQSGSLTVQENLYHWYNP